MFWIRIELLVVRISNDKTTLQKKGHMEHSKTTVGHYLEKGAY